MVTLDPRYPPTIVGSFKYIVHEYPADIDLFENYHSCCGLDQATRDVAKKITDMVNRIKIEKDVYLGDFKAGYDMRYKINIGQIIGGKLTKYDPFAIRSAMIALHSKRLITDEELGLWLSKVIDRPSVSEYMDLDDAIRKKYVIRWDVEDIVKGFKKLPLGDKKTLEEALSQKTVVKIDIWVYLNKRYVEVTNWFMLTYEDKEGRHKHMSIKPEKYERSLQHDLEHYSNPTVNKFMKLAKRLWLYAVLKKDKKLMTSLYPLFGSGAAKMYQIMGEIETIQKVLNKVEKPFMDSIISNIEDWKTRIGTIMSDILPIQVAHTIFSKINEILANHHKIDLILYNLEDIADKLNQFVNRYVKLYFKRNRINVYSIMNR
jgi:hypothetical protein